MRKILFTLIFSLLLTVLVSAQGFDDRGNPNDPAINERANACFDGGSMVGRCETELDWVAGWYLIRFEAGIFDWQDIPPGVAWILPPDVPQIINSRNPVTGETVVCFNGSIFVNGSSGTVIYQNEGCSIIINYDDKPPVFGNIDGN